MYLAEHFIAHRGYARHYPENTLTAMTAAIRAGAVNIELDIQFSKDGQAFVYHDDTLNRVSGVDGRFFDFTAEQLHRFYANEASRLHNQFTHVPLCPINELLELMLVRHQVHFFIELKEESTAHFGAEFCLQRLADALLGTVHNFTLMSDDLHAMTLAKNQYGFTQTGIVFRDWPNRNALIAQTKADIAFINIKRIPEHEPIHADCPIAVYEIDDFDFALATLARGAAKIETFAIGELLTQLCKHNTTSQ